MNDVLDGTDHSTVYGEDGGTEGISYLYAPSSRHSTEFDKQRVYPYIKYFDQNRTMSVAKRPQTIPTHTLTVFHYSPSERRFVKQQTERELHSHEVLIRTTHSGLCYTDVHAKESGCGLGHEGVGIIEAVGDEVVDRSVGQRVGWG